MDGEFPRYQQLQLLQLQDRVNKRLTLPHLAEVIICPSGLGATDVKASVCDFLGLVPFQVKM